MWVTAALIILLLSRVARQGIYFPNMPDKFICSAVLWDLTMSGSFVGTSVRAPAPQQQFSCLPLYSAEAHAWDSRPPIPPVTCLLSPVLQVFAISLARRLETSYTLKANLEDALRIVALTFFNTPQNAGAPPAGATAGAGILLAPPATAAAARAEEIAAGKRKAVVLVEAATGRTREQAGAAPRRYTVAGPATARLYLPPPPAVPLSSSGSGASTSQAGVAGVLRTSSAGSSIGGGHGRKRRAGGVIEIVPPARRRSSGIGSRNSSSSSSLQQLDAAVSGAAQAATMLLSPRPGAEASPSASSSDGAKWTPRPQDPAAAGGETTSGGAAAAEQPSAVPAAAKRIDMLVAASAATATTAADQTGTIQRRSSSSALAAEGGSMTLSRRHSSQADGGGEQDLAFSLLAPSPAVLRSRLPSSDATMGDAGVGDVEIVMGSSSDSGGSGGDITGRGSYGAAGDGSSVLPQKEEENSGVTVTEIPGTAEKAAPDHVQPTEQLLSYPVPEEVPARRSVTASARAALSSWWALRARTEAVLGGGASSKVQPTTGESQVKQQSRRSVSPSLRLQNGGTAASGLLGAANGSPRIPPLLVSEPANLLASREEGSGMA